MLLEDLLATLPTAALDQLVQDVLVGLYWTAVRSQRGMGLAATPNDITCCFNEDVAGVGQLHAQPARALAARLTSAHPVDASLGLATLNSLIEVDDLDLEIAQLLIQFVELLRAGGDRHHPFDIVEG